MNILEIVGFITMLFVGVVAILMAAGILKIKGQISRDD